MSSRSARKSKGLRYKWSGESMNAALSAVRDGKLSKKGQLQLLEYQKQLCWDI